MLRRASFMGGRRAPRLEQVLASLGAKLDHAQAVPSTYFGMHHLGFDDNTPVPGVNYGPMRLWDLYAWHPTLLSYKSPIVWDNIHTADGVFDWTLFDVLMTKLTSRGKTGDLVLTFNPHYPPAWAGAIGSAGYYTAFNAFVTAITARAGNNIRMWGLCNEPNNDDPRRITDAQLATLASNVSPIIKAANANNVVLSPEYQGNATGSLDAFLAAGGGAHIDVVAVHLYGPPNPLLTNEQGGVQAIIANYKTVMANRGISSKAIWMTEGSEHRYNAAFTGTAEERERDWVSQSLPLHWGLGLDRLYYYAWDSDEAEITGNLNAGIGNNHLATRNVAGIAWDNVRDWMLGKVVGTPVITGARHDVPVTGSGYTGRIAWVYGDTGFTTFAAGTFTRMRLVDGTEYSIGASRVSVPVGNTSIILDNVASVAAAYTTPAVPSGLLAPYPDFNNAAWAKQNVSLTTGQADPNGGTTGERVRETATTAEHYLSSGTVTKAAVSTAYEWTSRLKADGRTSLKLEVFNSAFNSGNSCFVDLSTGATVNNGAGTGFTNNGVTAHSMGDGWWEFRFRFVSDTNTGLIFQVRIQNPQGTETYLGDVTKGFLSGGFGLRAI